MSGFRYQRPICFPRGAYEALYVATFFMDIVAVRGDVASVMTFSCSTRFR